MRLPDHEFAAQFGGYWSEHPKYRLWDWREEVAEDYTRQSYWQWVQSKIEEDGDD